MSRFTTHVLLVVLIGALAIIVMTSLNGWIMATQFNRPSQEGLVVTSVPAQRYQAAKKGNAVPPGGWVENDSNQPRRIVIQCQHGAVVISIKDRTDRIVCTRQSDGH